MSMGTLARQLLLLHFSGGRSSRPLGLLINRGCGYGYGHTSTSGFASTTEGGSEEASVSSSWLQKLKGVFRGKGPSETKSDTISVKVGSETDFTMENFADELKKARQFGSMTTFGRGLPRGGEMSAVKSLERQENILRALHRRDPLYLDEPLVSAREHVREEGLSNEILELQRVGAQQKTEVATECGCTTSDVENVVAKYEWAKEANARVLKLKEEGKPLPKSLNEVEALMGGSWNAAASVNLAQSGNLSRNAPCPCGSGKKYKRCCGKVAT